MTITVNLPEDTFAALRADAKMQGRSAEDVAAEHLAALYTENDLDTALEEAFAQLDAGLDRPLEEVADELRARFDALYPLSSGKAP
jgi:plasmid stability protein